MPTVKLTTKYKKNNGLIISPDELLSLYFYGIDLRAKDGTIIDNYTISTYIRNAQSEIEKYFDFKILPKLVTETQDYYRDDYTNGFPFIRTSLPCRTVHTLMGFLNGIEQIHYPEGWLQMRRSTENRYYRQFSVIPNGSVINADANVILTGISAQYGLTSYPQIPNYWTIQYETGFPIDKLPYDILNLVGMLASIPIFVMLGDLVLGGGVSSVSLGIDGLSQNISTTKSATSTAYSGRIKHYLDQIKLTSERLKRTYKGISFASL